MTAGPLLGGALAAAGGTAVGAARRRGDLRLRRARCAACCGRAASRAREAHGERARDGIVLLFRDRTLGVVLATVLASLLFMSASIAAEVVFLKDDLGLSGAAYGVLFSSWTVGMVFGALVVSRRVRAGALAGAALVAVGRAGRRASGCRPSGSRPASPPRCGSPAASATASRTCWRGH